MRYLIITLIMILVSCSSQTQLIRETAPAKRVIDKSYYISAEGDTTFFKNIDKVEPAKVESFDYTTYTLYLIVYGGVIGYIANELHDFYK